MGVPGANGRRPTNNQGVINGNQDNTDNQGQAAQVVTGVSGSGDAPQSAGIPLPSVPPTSAFGMELAAALARRANTNGAGQAVAHDGRRRSARIAARQQPAPIPVPIPAPPAMPAPMPPVLQPEAQRRAPQRPLSPPPPPPPQAPAPAAAKSKKVPLMPPVQKRASLRGQPQPAAPQRQAGMMIPAPPPLPAPVAPVAPLAPPALNTRASLRKRPAEQPLPPPPVMDFATELASRVVQQGGAKRRVPDKAPKPPRDAQQSELQQALEARRNAIQEDPGEGTSSGAKSAMPPPPPKKPKAAPPPLMRKPSTRAMQKRLGMNIPLPKKSAPLPPEDQMDIDLPPPPSLTESMQINLASQAAGQFEQQPAPAPVPAPAPQQDAPAARYNLRPRGRPALNPDFLAARNLLAGNFAQRQQGAEAPEPPAPAQPYNLRPRPRPAPDTNPAFRQARAALADAFIARAQSAHDSAPEPEPEPAAHYNLRPRLLPEAPANLTVAEIEARINMVNRTLDSLLKAHDLELERRPAYQKAQAQLRLLRNLAERGATTRRLHQQIDDCEARIFEIRNLSLQKREDYQGLLLQSRALRDRLAKAKTSTNGLG